MKNAIRITIFMLGAICLAQGQDISGDWQGTLVTETGQLRVILHITRQSDGSWSASLDSVDQNAFGIPVSSISVNNAKLKLTIEKIHASYEGKVNSDATKIYGTWTQSGGYLDLDFKRPKTAAKTTPHLAPPSNIAGAWLGAIEVSGVKLRVIFHITNTVDGLTATMDSPDQGTSGIPVTSVSRSGSSLKMEMKPVESSYEGKLSDDLATMTGTLTARGISFPLTLTHVKNLSELERRRPQNPVKPYPYREEDVSYQNHKAQGVLLAATLTIPPGNGPFPAVLLISGSGPHDRDESVFGHKPFLVLADYLTRKGIVVLRADDRGVGKSTGDRMNATTADFATDAEAGVAYLKTRSEVNHHKTGLIGHSEGALVGAMVAARNPDIAFLVMMAGPGVPGDEVLPEQVLLLSEAAGASHEEAEKAASSERAVLNLIKTEKNDSVLDKELREKLAGSVPETQMSAQIKGLTSPWFRYFLAYDPATALKKVQCPVLAINGQNDRQVSPTQNLPAIRKALQDGGNQHFEVDELPNLNHLFQTAKTGSPNEYGEIEQTIAPAALQKIADWILIQ